MFEFDNIVCSPMEITANYTVKTELACFEGHFPGQPIMPAAAQLQMVEALISLKSTWSSRIHKGKNFKFLRHIVPGDILTINLVENSRASYTLSLSKASSNAKNVVASKGTLSLLPGDVNG